MIKHFFLKWFYLALVICLHTNSDIWLIDRTLSGAAPDKSGPGSDENEGVFHIPPVLLEPHHQIV